MHIRANFNDTVIDPEGLKAAAIELYSLATALAMKSGDFKMRWGLMEVTLISSSAATVEFFGVWPSWATPLGSVILVYDAEKSTWTHAGILITQVRECARKILDAMDMRHVDVKDVSLIDLHQDAQSIRAHWRC